MTIEPEPLPTWREALREFYHDCRWQWMLNEIKRREAKRGPRESIFEKRRRKVIKKAFRNYAGPPASTSEVWRSEHGAP